jgi:hypothetical protein
MRFLFPAGGLCDFSFADSLLAFCAQAAAAKKALEDEEKAEKQRMIDLELGGGVPPAANREDEEGGGGKKKKKKGRAMGDADFGFGTLEVGNFGFIWPPAVLWNFGFICDTPCRETVSAYAHVMLQITAAVRLIALPDYFPIYSLPGRLRG